MTVESCNFAILVGMQAACRDALCIRPLVMVPQLSFWSDDVLLYKKNGLNFKFNNKSHSQ